MTAAVSSGYPTAITLMVNTLPLKDLYPQEIIAAIGGDEAIEKLEVLDVSVDYIVNLKRGVLVHPNVPMIKRGLDQNGRPFLVIFVPGRQELFYHTRTNCSTVKDFTNLNNWNMSVGTFSKCSIANNKNTPFLPFLTKIMRNKDRIAAHKAELQLRGDEKSGVDSSLEDALNGRKG